MSQQKSNILQNFDIFGSPFYQKINQDDYKKKTAIGGIFSILLVSFSISYLLYLIIQIETRKLPPNFIQYDENMSEGYEYNISSQDFVVFIQQDLYQIEQEKKIQYFDITLSSFNPSSNETYSLNSYYIENGALKFGEYNPIDLTIKSNQSLFILGQVITVNVTKCSGNLLRYDYLRCATLDEINDLLTDGDLYISILVKQNSFSIKKQETYETLLTMFSALSINTQQSILVKASVQEVNIQHGLFFQSNNQHKQIYKLEQQNFFQTGVKSTKPLNSYAELIFYLDNQVRYVEMQYTKLPQIWAQVWALTSLLYLSRHIFQRISLTSLAQDFLNIQLKYYYKKAALRLSQENDSQKQNESYQDSHQKAEFIQKQNEDIQNNQNYFTRYQKWKTFLLPRICMKKKKGNNQNQKILNLLKKQTNKDLCQFEKQKEFLRLKIAIKLLLTPEQYAAIHMCGCDLFDDEQKLDLEQRNNQSKKESQIKLTQEKREKNLNLTSSDIQNPISNYQVENNFAEPISQRIQNHLEIMEKVEIDSEYRKSCLEKFLSQNQYSNKSEQEQLNQRILNCIIGIQNDNINDINQVEIGEYKYIKYNNTIQNNKYTITS
ncbi:hypothetical protein ABPG74_007036 [Tetrahymena malaccensis]